MGKPRLTGMQGARRLRRDKRGIPRLAGESQVGSPAWHARLIFTAAESMQQLLDQARLLHGIILPLYPEHALQLPSGASGPVREGMLQNA